jgi:hypothetical protein
MATKSVYRRDFQRYPYHYCLTSDGLNLDLCSLERCSYLHVGNLGSHWKKTVGLVIKNQNHRGIQKIMRNLSMSTSTQSQKLRQNQKRRKVLQLIRSNRCSRKIKNCSYWEMSQKQGKPTQQLKERGTQLQVKLNEFVSVEQVLAHRASESSFVLYRSSSWLFLPFIYCSAIFIYFH